MHFPVLYSEEEYNPQLGLYQHYLHGDKNQKIEKMYAMSIFQFYTDQTQFVTYNYQKYAAYLELSVRGIIENTSDWYIRIYMDESLLNPKNPDSILWKQKLEILMRQSRIQIICVKFPKYYLIETYNHQGLLAVMFRYLSLFDPNTSIILFRDVDNIWTEQHQYFVDKWLDRGDDICLFLNNDYKRQQVCDLTPDDLILDDTYYITLFGGLWNIRKPLNTSFSISIWQKMFSYIESYTSFAFKPEYKTYKFYGTRFAYGFDELALSRIALPIFIEMKKTFYIIPLKIYDFEYFSKLFNNPVVNKFLRNISDKETIATVKDILINKYWDMYSPTSGMAQYILCIITNIYFDIIMKKSKYYTSDTFINGLKNQIIPHPLLMSIGIFNFKNFDLYNWYPIDNKSSCGSTTVKKFIETNTKLTLEDWTAGSVQSPCPYPCPCPPPCLCPSPTPCNPPYNI
jgi:hypothetical protein